MTNESETLSELYAQRKGHYSKPKEEEDFLSQLNEHLAEKEQSYYKDYEIEFPFIFVFGLPRSGTTLITQVIAHCFKVGYINNFVARFYRAPIQGIRLSKIFFGNEKHSSFKSDYAKTSHFTDIHEFGYYWRYWLKKETFTGVTQADKIEKDIDWKGLRRSLANIQAEFKQPMVFKNIFGSYHITKLNDLLKKVIFIYITRDPLDSAISILDARRKYYKDPNTWWSYMPVEYEQLRNLDYWQQIAGQVFFLKKYYDKHISNPLVKNILTISYEELSKNPLKVIRDISEFSKSSFGAEIEVLKNPPKSFPFRVYNDRDEDKQKFKDLIADFRNTV